MPYSPRYLMQQAARGRPMPSGRPEDHLFEAVRNASSMDIERAIQMGARPAGARDRQGRTPAQALLAPENRNRIHPERILAAAKTLARNQGLQGGEGTQGSVVRLAAQWADSPGMARAWWHLWSPTSQRGLGREWERPSPDGTTPLSHWKAKASPELLVEIERVFPEPAAPKPRFR